MRLVSNIHELTIGNWIKYDATSDLKYIKRYPIPDIFIRKQIEKLTHDLKKLFKEKDIEQINDSELLRTILTNNITLFTSLYIGLTLTNEGTSIGDYFREQYKEKFFVDFKDYNTGLKKINAELKKNQLKLRDLSENDKTEDVKVSLADLIGKVETILGISPFDRNLSVFEFKNYFDKALKKNG